jgi:hypothetical protein
VEENPEVITDIARKTGTTEDEARAIYHLTEAERLLSVIHSDVTKDLGTIVSIRQHFDALYSSLALRVVARDYPEGWGDAPEGPEHGTQPGG